MLSYTLGIGVDQSESKRGALRIVVDDCAISGARFLSWLNVHPGSEVVFAHLYSHPGLRNVLRQDPRVVDCVAVGDLVDHAPDRLGDGYGTWLDAWRKRSSGVWAGQIDRIAFAWNEPDTAIWNSATGEVERGWKLVGPQRCLKNRRPIPESAIQRCVSAGGELTPGPGVLWADLDSQVVLADTPSGEVLRLSGVGAAMWLEAVGSSTEEEALGRLISRFDVDVDEVRSDWDGLMTDLIARGLLARS
jgi:hypothetical protein